MKLHTKLILAFMCCGLVPLTTATVLSYRNSSASMETIEKSAIADLENKAKDQLVALRDVKKAQIQDYFSSIRDQVLTFSEDKMVVDAMGAFPTAFNDFRNEANVYADELVAQRKKLLTYYTDDFSGEYRSQNEGSAPNAKRQTPNGFMTNLMMIPSPCNTSTSRKTRIRLGPSIS